ncbi:hypothetical protein P7C73_g5497, partial [Tremellales sp. Uapishka_1]
MVAFSFEPSYILLALLPLLAVSAPVEPEPLHRLPLRKLPNVRDGEVSLGKETPVASADMLLVSTPCWLFRDITPPLSRDYTNSVSSSISCTCTTDSHQLKRHRPTTSSSKNDLRRESVAMWLKARSLTGRSMKQVNDLDAAGHLDKRLYFKPAPSAAASDGNEDIEDKVGGGGRPSASGAATASAAAAATTTITASGSNANGFSNADLKAEEDNSVVKSSSALVAGALNYEIEGNDVGYLATVQIGTPPQDFLMLMDTGSGDTWVPSTSCSAAECGKHQALGTGSSTFVASQTPFQVTYGSGAVAGTLCSDTLSIAGMTLDAHTFGTTTQESVQFSGATVPSDGLMGLSFSTLSQQKTSTPIESLATAGAVKQAIMGIALGRTADGTNDGEINFGAADSSKLDASTTQTLAVSSNDGFWQVALGAVTVNGANVLTGRQAILDTGTTLAIAPGNEYAKHQAASGWTGLTSSLQCHPPPRSNRRSPEVCLLISFLSRPPTFFDDSDGQGGFTIPCTTNAQVTMTFGSVAFQIDARDLIFTPVNANEPTGDCQSSISTGTVTDDVTWLLGDTFLKNVYMTTNVNTNTVQLSARTDSPGSSSAATANGSTANASANTTTREAVASSAPATSQSGKVIAGVVAGLTAILAHKEAST